MKPKLVPLFAIVALAIIGCSGNNGTRPQSLFSGAWEGTWNSAEEQGEMQLVVQESGSSYAQLSQSIQGYGNVTNSGHITVTVHTEVLSGELQKQGDNLVGNLNNINFQLSPQVR